VQILFFAWLRDRAGAAELTVTPPAGIDTVARLIAWLAAEHSGAAAALADPARVRVAVNCEHVGLDAPVAAADEIAFFPPVTGGSGSGGGQGAGRP
jgi:molybdopterin synthase sulfur carrier subunit